jgi:hypothetical protein
MQALDVLAPIGIAFVAIAILSRLPRPMRDRLGVVLVAGAGAAYLGGGLGPLEVAYTLPATFVAYRAPGDRRWIGVGWAMHAAWDAVHHVWGHDILPFAPGSSFGCAICDLVLAAWYLLGSPRVPKGRQPD